jgi:hypothetical protein
MKRIEIQDSQKDKSNSNFIQSNHPIQMNKRQSRMQVNYESP